MNQLAQRCVLFADMRGSTALYETLGNAQATAVVTRCIATMQALVAPAQGRVVKTLGDGLMAVFEQASDAVRAGMQMREALEQGTPTGVAAAGSDALRLQIGVARGEVVEQGGDCYGDAVNVAARLLDHAGDNEILITADVLAGLPEPLAQRFRSLDRIGLRGRSEPVLVYAQGPKRASDTAATLFGEPPAAGVDPDTIALAWAGTRMQFDVSQLPLVVGRSPQAGFRVDDSRVSRLHARVDWHGGCFQLSDLSYNGTHVQFADGEVVSLRRGSCLLHGAGAIGLGGSPAEATSAFVGFEVYRCAAA